MMEYVRMIGSWRLVVTGFGAMLVFGAASFVAIVRELTLVGEANAERREHWRGFGQQCIETAAAGAMLGGFASVVMVARWVFTR